jgi:NAD(P)H dehydrogenase (quinone)
MQHENITQESRFERQANFAETAAKSQGKFRDTAGRNGGTRSAVHINQSMGLTMIVVTGATGKLGRHIIGGLLEKVPATTLAAAVRNLEDAADLIFSGVRVRKADYSKAETLALAFKGAKKLLLISSSEVGQRTVQHENVVAAAKDAGVRFIAYTSILRADSSTLAVAREHKATEEVILASGLDFAFLRNGWYLENHTENLGPALENGVMIGAAGQGQFASASRSDYAAAAVAVLTSAGHENKIYELAGDNPFTLKELASEVSKQTGTPVTYRNLSPSKYKEALAERGTAPHFADVLVDCDIGASRGELDSSSCDLQQLIGRPTRSLVNAVASVLSH